MENEMKIDEERGICNARTRLDDALQNIINKNSEDKSESEEEKEQLSPDVDIGEYNNMSIHRKSNYVKTRKRKRKEESPQKDSSLLHHSYVMKMFDRSVDLAQFDSGTPLYPICRAWISNDPQNQHPSNIKTENITDSEEVSNDDSVSSKNIHRLPAPDPMPVIDGVVKDLRIPEPLPPQKDAITLDSYIHDEAAAPQREAMLMDHMNRWKEVRNRWKAAAIANEARFAKSAAILKSIFEQ